MKKISLGFTKEKATEDVIDQYEEELMVRLEQISRTEKLAESSRAIPFISYSLKNSLIESDMKTKQL